MAEVKVPLLHIPDSAQDLQGLAERALRGAGALGKLPTPIDDLVAAAKIIDFADPETAKERFLRTLAKGAVSTFLSAWQKLRGIADLRDNVIYVPRDTMPPRVLFAKTHEFGHQVIPWHRVPIYLDDDKSLRPDAEELFDREANYFAAEVIFQGKNFRTRALDYRPSLAAVFTLADQHGASRQATLRRYVEGHDESIAAVSYLPSRYTSDADGYPALRAPQVVASPSFLRRYAEVELPQVLPARHPWTAARSDGGGPRDGHLFLDCGKSQVRFEWQAWWNNHGLLVLLRRAPVLGFVGRLVRG
jgi:hypothetical protein